MEHERTTIGSTDGFSMQVKINQIVPPGTNGARMVVKSKYR